MTGRRQRTLPPVRGSPALTGNPLDLRHLAHVGYNVWTPQMAISLPLSLSAAVASAETLESRIAKTRAALASAQDRAERGRTETTQAQAECDRLASERDLALAAVALGEAPEVDLGSLEKLLSAASKRLSTETGGRDAAEGVLRGLQARLGREIAERPGIMAEIEAGQRDARLQLEAQCTALFDRIANLIVRELGPLVQAEAAIGGGHVAVQLRNLVLDNRGPDYPIRHVAIRHEVTSTPVPPDFKNAAFVAHRLAHAATSEDS